MWIPNQDLEAVIASATLERHLFPLIKPYVLSFTTLTEYTSLQMTITLESGVSRTAEVVPLPGYSDETEESISRFLARRVQVMPGKTLQQTRATTESSIAKQPFATSPILTAIDLFSWQMPASKNFRSAVLPCSTTSPSNVAEGAKEALRQGRILKVKLSGDPELDISSMEVLKDISIKDIRLDANQAYSYENAVQLSEALHVSKLAEKIAYLEQPFDKSDWKSHERFHQEFPQTPLMLDESVITDEHVMRACEAGIPYLKLKLFKQGGITETLRQAEEAVDHEVKVIFGNGVATAMSNDVENSIIQSYPELFHGDSEANGHEKLA